MVEAAGGEMGVHLPSAGVGVCMKVGVGVQLGEKFLDTGFADGEHEGLAAIVTDAEVSLSERFGHGDLWDFLAIAKNAEFGFAAEDFAPSDQAGLPALHRQTVIAHDFGGAEINLGLAKFDFGFGGFVGFYHRVFLV